MTKLSDAVIANLRRPPSGVVGGRFEIEREAGAGGMAIVYRAIDRRTQRPVALKILRSDERLVARFEREAAVLERLRHPGIVRYVDHGTSVEGDHYLAMEWLEGESLSARLGRGKPSVLEVATLGRCVADALAAAHAIGVVHRDIKPDNLFLENSRADEVRILDFGVAHVADSDRALTRSRDIIGTTAYLAPEQARGLRDLDARADLYALGCVLFRCIAGRTVFEGVDLLTVLARIVLEPAPRVSDFSPEVPRELDELVAQMLAKSPRERPQSAMAVRDALNAIVERARYPSGEGIGRNEPMLDRSLGARDDPSGVSPTLAEADERLAFAVLARRSGRGGEADTWPEDALEMGDSVLRATTSRFGGMVQVLVDGMLVVVMSTDSEAHDQAAAAARCAQAARAVMPNWIFAVVSGRVRQNRPGGLASVVADGAPLLANAREGDIRLDPTVAGLLDSRFEVAPDADWFSLVSSKERSWADGSRTLLGKPTPCVGRERELVWLAALFDECIEASAARIALVVAEAGIGKSRLRHEFLARLRDRRDDVLLLMARGDPMRSGDALGILRGALRDAAGIFDGEPAEEQHRKLVALAGAVSESERPRVAEFLGHIVGAHLDESWRSAPSDAELRARRMRGAWEEWLAAECARRPVLLVIEDLHWGDRASVDFLDAALSNLRDAPLMVCALARPEVHGVFPQLWTRRPVTEMNLPPLTRSASERIVRFALEERARTETVERLVIQASGNAFFLEELVRAVSEGSSAALPATVKAMLETRIDRLELRERKVLRAASVFGRTFWIGGVRALVDSFTGESLERVLSELVDREFITEARSSRVAGQREYSFRHALMRDATYGTLRDAERAALHQAAAQWLESAAGASESLVIAEHFESGAAPQRAVAWYRRAAEQALAGSDLDATVAQAERGVCCGAQGDDLGALLLLQAEAFYWRGESELTLARATEAKAVLSDDDPRYWRAVDVSVGSEIRLGNSEGLRRLADVILDGIRLGCPASQLVAACRAAMGLCELGSVRRGRDLMAAVERITNVPDGDPRIASPSAAATEPTVMGRLLAAKCLLSEMDGDFGGALESLEGANVQFECGGDQRSVCQARMNMGLLRTQLGDFDGAQDNLEVARSASERMGLWGFVAYADTGLGVLWFHRGRAAEARERVQQAIETFGRLKRPGAYAHMYLARILVQLGDDGAEAEARRAVKQGDMGWLRPASLATLARVLLAAGRVAEGRAAAIEAMGFESTHSFGYADTFVRLVHAETLHASGDMEAARAAIAQARDRLTRNAGLITDLRLRESYLANIDDHVRIVDLARAWLEEGH